MRYPMMPGVPGVFIEGSYRGHKAIPGKYRFTLKVKDRTLETGAEILANPLYATAAAEYKDYHAEGKAGRLPKMLGWQAEGAAPIVRGAPVRKPETVATAIRIGNPASWRQAEAARDESGGLIRMVSDAEILEAYKLVAETEGVFCEPASAASIAGVVKLGRDGFFRAGQRLVCTLTGHGLKDPDNAIAQSVAPVTIPPTLADVLKVLGF
jgi:threonine synthase